jgi:beta-phosphoglucomutase
MIVKWICSDSEYRWLLPTLKAILFDFDGVIANTEPLHFSAFRQVLHQEGIELSELAYAESYVGLTDVECFRAILTAHKRMVSTTYIEELVQRKTKLMQGVLSTRSVLIPGVAEFIKIMAACYRLAIVSGALRAEIHLVLLEARLATFFEHITSAEDAVRGKPDPALYQHALHQLDKAHPLLPLECLAIEDTPHGIQAAQRAGLRCLAVGTTLPPTVLTAADAVTDRLRAEELPWLIQRFWA